MSTSIVSVDVCVPRCSLECTQNIFRDFEYKRTSEIRLLIYLRCWPLIHVCLHCSLCSSKYICLYIYHMIIKKHRNDVPLTAFPSRPRIRTLSVRGTGIGDTDAERNDDDDDDDEEPSPLDKAGAGD